MCYAWLFAVCCLCCAGEQNMRFYNVQDMRADGLYIENYSGPGLEVSSYSLELGINDWWLWWQHVAGP